MLSNVKFFCSSQDQVYSRYSSDLFWFKLGITAGNDYHGLRCFTLNTSNQHPALLICIISNRAGIDDIHICHFIKASFFKAIILQEPANSGGFGEVKLTAQGM